MTIILVPGTWALRGEDTSGQWWNPNSPFAQALGKAGHTVLGRGDDRPFVWSTNVNAFYAIDHFMDWRAGGQELYQYAVPSLCPDRRVPAKELAVIAHSHGLQVVKYAADAGLEIATLVSVCSPIRADVDARTPKARANIGRWTQFYSDDSDAWQIAGDEPGDVERTAAHADENIFVPSVGHTGMLTDPVNFPRILKELQ